jgi:hypothetical protein
MKTKLSHLFPVAAAFVVAQFFTGCADTPGPITRAVQLSNLKTFNVVATLPKDATTADAATPPREPPPIEVLAQTVREEATARGYQPQATAPDFLIAVDWLWFDKMVQTSQPGPGVTKIDQVSLSIVVKDTATNEILWRNPATAPIDAQSLPIETVRAMVRTAMKDFPPAQPAN